MNETNKYNKYSLQKIYKNILRNNESEKNVNYKKFNEKYYKLIKMYIENINSIIDKKFIKKNIIHSYDINNYLVYLYKKTHNKTGGSMNKPPMGQTSDSFTSCSESLVSSMDSCTPKTGFFSIPNVFSNDVFSKFKLPSNNFSKGIDYVAPNQCGSGLNIKNNYNELIYLILDNKINFVDNKYNLSGGNINNIPLYFQTFVQHNSKREFTQKALLKFNNLINNQIVITF
jgi:hypothetical protein